MVEALLRNFKKFGSWNIISWDLGIGYAIFQFGPGNSMNGVSSSESSTATATAIPSPSEQIYGISKKISHFGLCFWSTNDAVPEEKKREGNTHFGKKGRFLVLPISDPRQQTSDWDSSPLLNGSCRGSFSQWDLPVKFLRVLLWTYLAAPAMLHAQ